MIKKTNYLEAAASVGAIVLDKTGTITLGKPQVTAVEPVDDVTPEHLLSIAAAAERLSAHPIAESIVRESLLVASEICIYTNDHINVVSLP